MEHKKTYYVTTPIYYVNDVPHIGHAYTTIAADTMARYKRLKGYQVFFLTGTDEHGQKIQKAAGEEGMKPKALADKVVVRFKNLWEKLNITHDDFIRTTDPTHYRAVQSFFETVFQKGDIYKGEYEDWYCIPCETFWTELLLENGNCPDCGRPVEKIKEESYFFRMSKYQDRLLRYLKENPDFIKPRSRQNEIIRFVEGGLKDLSISRTSFDWGIPVPGDKKHVIYVWFDALTNYLTAVGYPNEREKLETFWPADVHIIGKDILRFHAVYWPTFLMSAGLPLPKKIFSHGWWTVNGEKMSKSKGNVVDPEEVIKTFGADPFRYFLLREVPFGLDGDFSAQALTQRFNSDLANDLGNLLSRTLKMVEQYAQGRIPQPSREKGPLQDPVEQLSRSLDDYMDRFEFHKALGEIFQLVERANRYIEESAPWKLSKSEKDRDRLNGVLYQISETLCHVGIFLFSFMPDTGKRIVAQLGLELNWVDPLLATPPSLPRWGLLQPGTPIRKGSHLFPRVEARKSNARTESETDREIEKPRREESPLTIQDFKKIQMRVGEILEAEPVPKSTKLLKLKVNLGTEIRQIVAGIGNRYTPETLIGLKVAVVSNLKPAKLMGVESQGMILAAGDEEVQSLMTFLDRDISPGTLIK